MPHEDVPELSLPYMTFLWFCPCRLYPLGMCNTPYGFPLNIRDHFDDFFDRSDLFQFLFTHEAGILWKSPKSGFWLDLGAGITVCTNEILLRVTFLLLRCGRPRNCHRKVTLRDSCVKRNWKKLLRSKKSSKCSLIFKEKPYGMLYTPRGYKRHGTKYKNGRFCHIR